MTSVLGKRSLDLEVLKEPRGFIRCLQWWFALFAFASMSDFFPKISADIVKFGEGMKQLDVEITSPSNFDSDAKFFLLIGVVSWLYCFVRYVSGDNYLMMIIIIFSIGIYLFYSTLYMDKQNKYPKIDFIITTLLSIFWLAAASAWANGLNGVNLVINHDNRTWTGHFTVLLGFINFFLWAANLWFLYKETSWFNGEKTKLQQDLQAGGVEGGVVDEDN
jgi:hypothetical protein